jgi:class 3 adenylate cyclase
VADLVPQGTLEVIAPSTGASDLAAWFEPVVALLQRLVTGTASSRVTDRTFATVMFTDIVGSTERAATLGDERWSRVLQTHESIVRDLVDSHGGTLVKMIGDGSLSTFDGPVRATRCASAVMSAAADVGVRLRVGLHAGEVEQLGHDIAGLAVHVAARVEAQADPGEVWLTESVHDLLAGSGVDPHPRGERVLKGVPGTWSLFSLRGPTSQPVLIDSPPRPTRPADRVTLELARRAPRLLRAVSRLGSRS